jgi:hypothetical protein
MKNNNNKINKKEKEKEKEMEMEMEPNEEIEKNGVVGQNNLGMQVTSIINSPPNPVYMSLKEINETEDVPQVHLCKGRIVCFSPLDIRQFTRPFCPNCRKRYI